MRYDRKKRVFMVEKFKKLNNFTLVQRSWRTQFPGLQVPTYRTIQSTVARFDETGSIESRPPKHAEASEKRENAKNVIQTAVSENPHLSVRKLMPLANVSYGTTLDILKNDLDLRPYKIQHCQELKPPDYAKRLAFAEWFKSLPPGTRNNMIFSDEAYFYLHLPVNKQNNREWAQCKPSEGSETPLQDQRVLVWCGISATRIYGPYFFDSTVKSSNYKEMLENFFWPWHARIVGQSRYYFQQDGAPPHVSHEVQNFLKDKFGDRFIDKTMWPPRSPDLNPCDFFLWGTLKGTVYDENTLTLDDLKANIAFQITQISQETLKKTFLNFEKRCDFLIQKKGGHIEIN
jgi:hypothetical protein